VDRGGDRKKLLEPLPNRHERFVIRSTGRRFVIDRKNVSRGVAELGARCRLKNLVVLVTAAAYFAATFLGQKMKLRILCEKLLIISQRFFGIPPFRN
jgi:hypothetical protein